MPNSISSNDGPFPTSGREDELQTESFRALSNALPASRFRLRDERADDKGVDASIELIAGGSNLNLRAQIQMKGTDSAALNSDNSLSYEVRTSNLNYLLQSVSSLYIIHINPINELRYAWARDEATRIEHANPDWRKQGRVTLRFAQVLDASALDDISSRIAEEAQVARDVLATLRAATSLEPLILTIDPSTLQIQTASEALRILEEGGSNLLAVMEAARVFGLYEAALPSASTSRTAQLIAAYALTLLGRYSEAIGHLSRFQLLPDPASDDSKKLAAYLSALCNFHLGRISAAALISELGAIAVSDDSEFALLLRIEAARRQALSDGFASGAQLMEVIETITNSPNSGSSLRFQAELIRLGLLGYQAVTILNETLSLIRSRERISAAVDSSPDLLVTLIALGTWELQLSTLLKDPLALSNPAAHADALALRLQTRFMTFLSMSAFSADDTATVLGEVMPADIEADLASALAAYQSLGRIESELGISLMHANYLEMAGRQDEAKILAQDSLIRAIAIGSKSMAEAARDLLDGKSPVANLLAGKKELAETDEDIQIARQDQDHLVESMSKHNMATLKLPDDRMPQLREDVKGMFIDATLRAYWCRHLHLVQLLTHTYQRETAFRDPLQWRCRCIHLKLESPADSSDIDELSATFKSVNCTGCTHRSPKVLQ